MELIQAGSTSSSATVTDSRTDAWAVINETAAKMTVTFYGDVNGTGPGKTITIPAANAAYVWVYGDFQKIVVTGGTVDYMIFG